MKRESMIPWLENRAKTYKSKDDMQALLETYLRFAKQEKRIEVIEQCLEALNLLNQAPTVDSFVASASKAGL